MSDSWTQGVPEPSAQWYVKSPGRSSPWSLRDGIVILCRVIELDGRRYVQFPDGLAQPAGRAVESWFCPVADPPNFD